MNGIDLSAQLNQELLNAVVRQRDDTLNRLANCEAALAVKSAECEALAARVKQMEHERERAHDAADPPELPPDRC